MKRVSWIALTLVIAASSNSFADECIPTKTVEQAKIELDATVARQKSLLDNGYALAAVNYELGLQKAEENRKAKIDLREMAYQEDMKLVMKLQNPNWRQELEELTAAYNKMGEIIATYFERDLDLARARYEAETSQSQHKYNLEVTKATQDYNQAVCAK